MYTKNTRQNGIERGREKQTKGSREEKSRKGRRIKMVGRYSNVKKKDINEEYQTEPNGKREGERD
jgi:hypothetical protein